MRLSSIIAGILLLAVAPTFGQGQHLIRGKSIVELRRAAAHLTIPSSDYLLPTLLLPARSAYNQRMKPPRLMTILKKKWAAPTVYSYDKLGLFCKFEVQLERVVKFPVKFRLGDVQYVDWLEGKRN